MELWKTSHSLIWKSKRKHKYTTHRDLICLSCLFLHVNRIRSSVFFLVFCVGYIQRKSQSTPSTPSSTSTSLTINDVGLTILVFVVCVFVVVVFSVCLFVDWCHFIDSIGSKPRDLCAFVRKYVVYSRF